MSRLNWHQRIWRTGFLIVLALGALTLFSFKKTIYKRPKTYVYEAVYIYPNGDTLSQEQIKLQPLGHFGFWGWRQTAYRESYFPDTLSLLNWVHPVDKFRLMNERFKANADEKGEPWYGFWSSRASSGAVENKTEVWTHPFRTNQYVYTELAPFPEIDRSKLYVDSTWRSVLILGWDNWAGRIENHYQTIGQCDYLYQDMALDDCWEIHAIGHHNRIGENTNHFLFHPLHGFVAMYYTFFNGTRIDFRLVSVQDKRKDQ